ncbi:pilus assembly protein PilP [Janthinobacterium sp. 17J80-10]|uniref:pilus assembly protein PilP n=1 Tax=Janthinobacterium sp. 17J80-10 TaxID=2497863 RepID=UPI00100583BB|nr:pilus assembly protein PilP [Janthinobacterium sp. 17J80-10]QAU35855.1 pilus assembly protein PilP [Janthinobacterium sp. 17J80-10]
MMTTRLYCIGLALAGAAALSGCDNGGLDEVRQWMDETRQQTKVNVPKLSEPKKFLPFSYDQRDTVDPYSPTKLAIALAKAKGNSSSILKPDMERRREALESYPLDTLRMVGTMQKPGINYALIQADRTVFHLKVGNYVGQNFGMITNITDTAVELKEIVQDASGEWVERQAKLELQEIK